MYDPVGDPRSARRQLDAPVTAFPSVPATVILGRIRKLLGGHLPGMSADRRWSEALSAPMKEPALECERLFALGWLRWLEGDFSAAESLLNEADKRCRTPALALDEPVTAEFPALLPALEPGVLAARTAYWGARVRVLLGKADAVAEYESAMRRLGGSGQVTAWYVDLLWRSGRIDRAEQVWKSVRANKRVLACDEGPLLEARTHLRKGELAPAEKLLRESTFTSGVAWVERQLLLCWTLASMRHPEQADDALRLACDGPYPSGALTEWRQLLRVRGGGEPVGLTASSPGWREFVGAQNRRAEGKREKAVALYRAASSTFAVQPFTRFGLACLGEDDFAAVLGTTPGLFFALRCRARQAVERFRLREISPAELLEVVNQASKAGYENGSVEHFARLAAAQQLGQPTTADLTALVASESGCVSAQRDAIQIAIEQAARRVAPAEALPLLRNLTGSPVVDGKLRQAIARQLLRLALLLEDPAVLDEAKEHLLEAENEILSDEIPPSNTEATPPSNTEATPPPQPPSPKRRGGSRTEEFRSRDIIIDFFLPLSASGRGLGGGVDELRTGVAGNARQFPAVLLLQAAMTLQSGRADEAWRATVCDVRQPRYRCIAVALLVHEAAGRGDLVSVGALLEDAAVWRTFRSGPPRFVLSALQALAGAHSMHPMWRRSLARWLELWDNAKLGPAGDCLAAVAGLSVGGGTMPAGVEPAAWFLHQASRALERGDAVAALAFTSRARQAGGDSLPSAGQVQAALPALQRRADAQALSHCLSEAGSPAELLTDFVDLLSELPEGDFLLQAARRGDAATVSAELRTLSGNTGLPGRLYHHLAVLAWRSALHGERHDQVDWAAELFHQSWQSWTAYLTCTEAPPESQRALLLNYLLGIHARRINELIVAGQPKPARKHFEIVKSLPKLWAQLAPRVAKFKEDLASQFLLTTREVMRHGTIPEGCRADYDRGLALLGQMMSLDRSSLPLLTALIEICCEWFVDLYNTGDEARLREQVRRFTPFALYLSTRADLPGNLSAQAALAEFYKFRGLVEEDPTAKARLYRDALKHAPSNAEVRELLANLDVSDLNDVNDVNDPEKEAPPQTRSDDD